MAFLATAAAGLSCSMGGSPSVLGVPGSPVAAAGLAATVLDIKPQANIPPFGVCLSLLNPAVATATTAAQGVLTPQPCTPLPTGPWAPGALTAKVAGIPCMLVTSKCACTFGGVISVVTPGQVLASAL